MTEWSRAVLDVEAARIFLADGPVVQPDLVRTLEDIEGFYEGPVARRTPPPFTPADFAAHRAEWVEPRRAPFAGVEVCELPPNSRGHLALEAIRRLEPLDALRPEDAEFHLRLIRALRAAAPGGDTIYLCVVDGRGMAVSLSQSLFMAFGSGVVVPGTGVLLHNRGAYHTRATYRGGARPVHTLAPAMALGGGRPRLVFGTMGGDAQVQIHLQLLARILVAGEPPERAIAAPRWTFTAAMLLVEAGLPPLAPPGLEVALMPVADLAGHAHAILVEEGGLCAACDPRADGVAVGE
jgi:gamma-glutamyltranspeptidase/glutathione hydrolase